MTKGLLLLPFLIFALSLDSQGQKEKKVKEDIYSAERQKNLTDSALLDVVERQTIRYFWEFAHPVSGMARERSNVAYNYGYEVVTTGGTGFGIMAIIAGVD